MSKKWLYVFFVLLLVVPLALAACGWDEEKAADLTETFQSESGLSIQYPNGWVAKDSPQGVLLANSEELASLLESAPNLLQPPEGSVSMLFVNPDDMAALAEEGQTPKDIAEQFADFNDETGDVKDKKIGENDGATVSIKSSKNKNEGFLAVWQDGDTMYIAVVMTREGELGKYEDTTLKILESVSYSAPAGEAGDEG